MKRSILLVLSLMLLVPAIVFAEEMQDGHEQDRAYLLDMLTRVEASVNKQQLDSLVSMLDENVVVIYQDAAVIRGVDQMKAYYEKMLGDSNPILKSYTTSAKHSAPARFIGDLAIVDGKSKDKVVFINGSEVQIDIVWTVTLQKAADGWKVIQLHFSGNMFDNPILAAAKDNLLMVAAGAGVGGLILGGLLGRRRFRKA